MMDRDMEPAKQVLLNNVSVKSGEVVLVLIDSAQKYLGDIFFAAAESIGAEVILMQYPTKEKSGIEPPVIIGEAMKMADVAICITKNSISHTMARKNAVKQLTRVATMPGLTYDMLTEGALTADYELIRDRNIKLKRILDQGKEVTIETGNYQLTFSINGRQGKASNGMLLNQGDSGNLPSGETFIAPMEGTANGEIVIDGSIAGIGLIKGEVVLSIRDGRLVDAEGESGKKLLDLLGTGEGRWLAELGIGTNDHSRITGNILEDEKKYGTCHVAFGTNITFGGKVDANVHLDAVTLTPKVLVDDRVVVSNGKIHI